MIIRKHMTPLVFAAALYACASVPSQMAGAPPQAADATFREAAARIAEEDPLRARARNVIIFIGDGMGVTTVTAARIYAGQRQNLDGESYELAIDTMPRTALSRTYALDSQISDSAPTATAILSGAKTNSGVIGLTAAASDGCGAENAHARSLLEIAEGQGMATGVVSTARITHATPAAAYAHTPERDWENDAIVARAGADCPDIARQLVEWPAGDGFEVALGGGRLNFLPATASDPEDLHLHGARADGRDLAAEWQARAGHLYLWNRAQLAAAPKTARVLGLFSPSHMAYEHERANDPAGEPSLAEMTAAAIERLALYDGGYVLLVEGGRIDHAHHAGQAGVALSETAAFDDAVRTALSMTSRDDTLILVTADHSHVLSMAGYARRGNPILGLSAREQGPLLAQDGRPYTTLGYMNGPGAASADGAPRPELSNVDTQDLQYRQQALVPMEGETHGGEDVALYAWGPGDDAVHGTIEQNAIFHIMARALGFQWRR